LIFSQEEFQYAVFKRFVVLTDKYCDYLKEHAELIDISTNAKICEGQLWKDVLVQSAVYYGELMELINIMQYFAFSEIINKNSMDLNPQSHRDLLNLCNEIMIALRRDAIEKICRI
jgi:hypothetical protein